jgi:hypothetical protein
MMFRPQYVDYVEASQIVAERVQLLPGRANPLDAAIAEAAIEVQLKVRGEWTVPPDGKSWRIQEVSLYHGGFSRDGRYWAEVSRDEVRFRTDDLDKLWPSGSVSDAAPNVDGLYISPFIRIMLRAIAHFEIHEKSSLRLKKGVLVDYFADQKLPDGTPISRHQAEMMATFIRAPDAMLGRAKRMG